MNRQRYDTDMTEIEWQLMEPVIPPANPGGRPREVEMREIMNGIFYILLDSYYFANLAEVRTITNAWLDDYNHNRPHDVLNGMTPIQMPR